MKSSKKAVGAMPTPLPGDERSLDRKVPGESAERILHRVRHHSRTQTAAQHCEYAEQHSIDRHDERQTRALVRMSDAEDDRLQKQGHDIAARPCRELFLQVTTKHHLFTKTRGNTEANPYHALERA